jgi:acyl-[acyl carrier protein]--UDP-N-acetylglucosamine O-acyltransferase
MSLLKFPKSLIMGKNNYIESGVKILQNVIIGNNNKIYSGTVIYPNTTIGNNNVILDNNILGEHPVNSTEIFTEKKFNGLEIGNNNFFHVNNLIFNGYYKKTIIGNDNKLLAETHIGHDTCIHNNATLYPRVITGGLSTIMDNSSIGMHASIQQNSVLGHFSMIGMGNIASHSIFPFYIYFNQKYLRFNKVKIPEYLQIDLYDDKLRMLIEDLKKNNCNKELVKTYNLPENINFYIYEFLDTLNTLDTRKIKKI